MTVGRVNETTIKAKVKQRLEQNLPKAVFCGGCTKHRGTAKLPERGTAESRWVGPDALSPECWWRMLSAQAWWRDVGDPAPGRGQHTVQGECDRLTAWQGAGSHLRFCSPGGAEHALLWIDWEFFVCLFPSGKGPSSALATSWLLTQVPLPWAIQTDRGQTSDWLLQVSQHEGPSSPSSLVLHSSGQGSGKQSGSLWERGYS